LVSRWNSGYPTGKWAFPARNQLMAGLSHATLIVEAGRHSGSLMTAKHAEEFDRDVFAIPGPIFSDTSYGPHMLIKNGAALISSSEDLLEALGFPVSRSGVRSRIMGQSGMEDLDEISKAIVGVISREEATVDMITEKTGVPLSALNGKLTLLEMEGIVRMDAGIIHLI
jgi:DNA processing protein